MLHVSGEVDHNYRLWLLLNLEVWQRLFIDGFERDELLGWLSDKRGGSRVGAGATLG